MSDSRGMSAGRVSARWCAVPAAVLLVAVLVGCSAGTSPGTAEQAVVVGSDSSVHGELIARLYAGALEHGGTRVVKALAVGDQAACLGALDAGGVTVLPELTGQLLMQFDPDAAVREPEKVYQALNRSLPQGLSVGDFSESTDLSDEDKADAQAQNVVALYRTGALSPRQLKKLNYVAGELSSADLTHLIEQVQVWHRPADAVTQDWLDVHGL